jgi:hypothetical protein
MKTIFYKLSLIVSVVLFFSFKTTRNDIKTAGNILLKKVSLLSDSKCEDLKVKKNYLIAYQQLYNAHNTELKDNSRGLELTKQKIINKQNCISSSLSIPDGYSLTRKVTIGGGGSGNITGKEVSPLLIATFYMSTESKEAYLSNLPEDIRTEYFNLSEDWKNEAPQNYNNFILETNKIKSLDKKNYVNWYFQNNNNPILQSMDNQNIEELKLDLKQKTLEFKQN